MGIPSRIESIHRLGQKVFAPLALSLICLTYGTIAGYYPLVAILVALGIVFSIMVFVRPFLATVAIVVALSFGELLNLPVTAGGLRLSIAILIASTPILFLRLLMNKDRDLFVNPFREKVPILIFLFVVAVSFSMINSRMPSFSIGQVQQFVYSLILFYYIYFTIKKRDELKIIVAALILGGIFPAIVGLTEALTGTLFFSYFHNKSIFGAYLQEAVVKNPAGRISGVLGDPEYHSVYMLTLLFLIVFSLQHSKSRLLRIPLVFYLLVVVINIVGTGYKGAIVAFAGSLLVYWGFIQLRRKWFILVISFVTIALIGVLMVSLFPELDVERLVEVKGQTSETLDLRLRNIRIGLVMWMDHPIIGQGPNGFLLEYQKYAPRLAPRARMAQIGVHNTYIQMLAEYGLVGFSLFVLILLYTVGALLFLIKKLTGVYKGITIAILASAAAYIIMMMGTKVGFNINLWLLIALTWAIKKLYEGGMINTEGGT